MSAKKCSRCGLEKSPEDFYRSSKTKDGRAYWCRSCMSKKNEKYFSTPEGREKHRKICRRYNKTRNKTRDGKIYLSRYPQKVRATQKARRAVLRGILKRPEVCSECGLPGRIQGHHDDYSKPLAVRWVCHVCHSKIHHQLKGRDSKPPDN